MDFDTILFIGKPGSGKGTQAKLLAEKTGFPIIASGDLFRAIVKEETHIGRKMKEEHEQGLLAPDWFAMYLFQKSVLGLDPSSGIIFDGFGRKVPEAKVVVDVLNWLERKFTALYVDVPDSDIIERLELRKESSGRADDHSVEKRLEEFRTYTEPSVEVFRQAGHLIEIDGTPSVEVIHADITQRLGLS
ncbi:MAG: nucleoside monophosphate kinase [Candidatus Pacebacteria bacterium]|nr:nucleoside monophosphate kinase [Candidatus Paceibacterota bacterium]MBP9840182.1 nucleoside monophosphate kinase [Candidatus Paceibacterota bacterium]